jgi:hypothetical protein
MAREERKAWVVGKEREGGRHDGWGKEAFALLLLLLALLLLLPPPPQLLLLSLLLLLLLLLLLPPLFFFISLPALERSLLSSSGCITWRRKATD